MSVVRNGSGPDWTRGPAKHAAGAVLLIAAIAGIGSSVLVPRLPAASNTLRDPAVVRIDLNTASAAELEALPRIGPALARRITEDRETRGPFRSIEDLRRVRGIGPRTIEGLRPFATAASGPQ